MVTSRLRFFSLTFSYEVLFQSKLKFVVFFLACIYFLVVVPSWAITILRMKWTHTFLFTNAPFSKSHWFWFVAEGDRWGCSFMKLILWPLLPRMVARTWRAAGATQSHDTAVDKEKYTHKGTLFGQWGGKAIPKWLFSLLTYALEWEFLCQEPLSPQIAASLTCDREGGWGQDDPLSLGCRSPTVSAGPQTFPETGRSFSQMKLQAGSLDPKF